jgi:hypothetical protein
MRLIVSTSIALSALAPFAAPSVAHSQISQHLPIPASEQIQLVQNAPQAPTPAPPKPYKAIPITLPAPANDPSFEAFRKQLADIARQKDRAALAKVTVTEGFFWEGESGDRSDPKKSGIDNLVSAISLDSKEMFGWDTIMAAAQDTTLEPSNDRKGVMCGPASPQFDEKALDEVTKDTQTDMSEWGYPIKADVEVRDAPQPTASVIEKLGLNLVRAMPEEAPTGGTQPPRPFMRVVTPEGKVGYVPIETVAPLTSDQMCYLKDANGWKITGYIGGQ